MDESDFSEGNGDGDEGAEEQLDPNNPQHEFLIWERNFNKTVAEIERDPNVSQYAEEFYKLFEKLYNTYQSKKELEDFNTALQENVTEKEGQIEAGLRLADADRSIIDDLKVRIEHSWKLADAAHAREQAAQEIIDNLRRQVENLNNEIEFRNKMSQDTTEETGEEKKRKEGLQREKEKLMAEVVQLTTKLNNALEYQIELEKKASSADLQIGEISAQLEEQTNEVERFKRIRDKLEGDVAELNYKIEDRDVFVNNLNNVINGHLKSIARLETQIKEDRGAKEKVAKELEVITAKHTKLLEDYNSVQFQSDVIHKKYNKKVTELKVSEEEVAHLKADVTKLTKQKDMAEKKNQLMEVEKCDLVMARNKLRERIAVFEREIDDLKRVVDQNQRGAEGLKKERDEVSKNLARQEIVARDQQKLIELQVQGKKKLERELDNMAVELNKTGKMIHGLERERDRLAEEQLDLTKKIENGLDDIKLKKAEIYDLKKSIVEHENKFKIQQNLFDAVRSERNALEKSLQESTADGGELRKKLKIAVHQIEQLKEDVAVKEQLLVKSENIFRKALKEKENLKIELNGALDTIKNLKYEIAEKQAEEKRLHKQLMDNERLIRDQANDLEQLQNERDIIGSQLVRRNDEIALLHEKIRIFQTTLQKGEAQYQQRLEDIRLLKVEIKRLRQEKNLLSKTINNSVDLKQEVFHLERDLTKMRLKCRALEEEVQNPMNIHRWRKLEGSDPKLLDLLQKVQLLQKRILKQSCEAVERERQLKEAERLYLNLKQVVSKQPGPTIQDELTKTQRALKARGEQLKCVVSELNMAELQVKEHQCELQRVTDELNELKKKYLAVKKAQISNRSLTQLQGIGSRDPNQNRQSGGGGAPIAAAQVKYTGGGFRMSVQSVTSNN